MSKSTTEIALRALMAGIAVRLPGYPMPLRLAKPGDELHFPSQSGEAADYALVYVMDDGRHLGAEIDLIAFVRACEAMAEEDRLGIVASLTLAPAPRVSDAMSAVAAIEVHARHLDTLSEEKEREGGPFATHRYEDRVRRLVNEDVRALQRFADPDDRFFIAATMGDVALRHVSYARALEREYPGIAVEVNAARIEDQRREAAREARKSGARQGGYRG